MPPLVKAAAKSADATSPPGGCPVVHAARSDGCGGEALDPEKLYGVASNNYIRNGGDGYSMFVDAQDAYDFGPDVADVTAEYLAANGPYTAYTDGRIKLRMQ